MSAIYHFTDVVNARLIVESGELCCHRDAESEVDVGDNTIKDRRTRIGVDCGPGGKVCDYVPFYFAPNSPMLFSIKSGNVPGVSSEQRRLVYFVTSTEAVYGAGLDCVYSDGNAAAAFTDFFDDPEEIDVHVDMPLMEATYWYNTPEDPDRRRRRMAEFLIHEAVPLGLFTEIGVYNSQARGYMTDIIANNDRSTPVVIHPGWYF